MDILEPYIPARIADALQKEEELLGITLTIHDLTGILRELGNPYITAKLSHEHYYCNFLRKGGFGKLCLRDCQRLANQQAQRKGMPFIHNCWKGAKEIVVPVMRGKTYVATFFAGIFKGKRPENMPDIMNYYEKLPLLSDNHAGKIANNLHFLAQGIFTDIESYHQIQVSTGDRKSIIRNFIQYHAHEHVKLEDLADTIYLSPSRTSHLVTHLFGIPFQQLLLEERIKRAKSYLKTTAYPLEVIAELVGLGSSHYLSRQFRKNTGTSPGKYREANSPHNSELISVKKFK